ncbi:MAG: class A beta-lactamase-related serine hydrolase [bacterium]|nr:class A beta-lactamase-related serine hydrolase [bacterium]
MRDLAALLRSSPQADRFEAMLANPAAHRLQILLAEPYVKSDGTVALQRSSLGDPNQYFYPASSIKLCGAIAALLECNRLSAQTGHAIGLSTPLVIEPRFAGDRARTVPSLARMLRELFLVSDNAAYNHCIEIVGAAGLNRAMWDAGFTSTRLWHRLSEARTLQENRQTRGVTFGVGPGAGGTFAIAGRETPIELDNAMFEDLELGTGYMSGGRQVDGPMSFASKNAIRLGDLQDVLVAVVRPEVDSGRRGFPELSVEQRAFVVRSLGQLPRESRDPVYDPAKVPDHACKFFLRGVRRVIPAAHLRIYDKIGRAYGFSTDNAYIEDTRTGRGFFLAAVLYTNPDGILNDDRYAYEELADPFFDDLGEVITRAVLEPSSR